MVSGISFRANETTGGVGEKSSESAKNETTGGVGVRQNRDSIFSVDNDLKNDTVSFKSNSKNDDNSITRDALGLAAILVLLFGTLGILHKYDTFGKIKNENVKKFFKHADIITEPCYKACKWLKNNTYDKLVALLKKK